MKKKLSKKISISAMLVLCFPLFGAEYAPSEPATASQSIIKKKPSTRGHIRFYETASPLALPLEKQMTQERIKAYKNRLAKTRTNASLSARGIATQKANQDWDIEGKEAQLRSPDREELLNRMRRKEKLTTLSQIEYIDPVEQLPLTAQETQEKDEAFREGKAVATFLKVATKKDQQELLQGLTFLVGKYKEEFRMLTMFMIERLIEKNIITDLTLLQKDLEEQIKALGDLGEFAQFERHVTKFFKKNQYAFPQQKAAGEPLVAYDPNAPGLPHDPAQSASDGFPSLPN